jgi:hypothetical protein
MANTDTPFGLKPIRHRSGSPYTGECNPYYVPSTYATALYIGDPVIITGTSNISDYQGYAAGSLPEINKATAAGGNYISGVIVAFGPDRDNLSRVYKPASTEALVWVADAPELIFEVQEDSDGTALAATSVGLNADLVYTHSGSTITGLSGVELDRSTAATTSTLQLKIMRLVDRPDNAIGDFAKWEVLVNLHTQRYTTGI